ncbi:hypothetical protein OU995_19095 [Roseateles sp. SL47]|uniref:hypothetical protein n=1 Tax=Roseateles sp. SL47 TaxID=2995138 RepID=UPI0022712619|nr:hypothetical protein [Roseateles sp. SL47]WAC71676.1 hypothetical protein OU995_19095 [Roseateles sp. SL47]
MTQCLTNGVFNMRLDVADLPEVSALALRLTTFLFPYLQPVDAPREVDLDLQLLPISDFNPSWKACCTQAAVIRETYAEGFTLRVMRGWLPDGRLVAWDEERQVGYVIHQASRQVKFHGDHRAFIHIIELVRYYGLLVEQGQGTAILHAAATLHPTTGEAQAVAGIKGAGKTTTMLGRVLDEGHTYFSGDKLLLDLVEGRVRARGWPDFPHIGLGTLRQFPSLVEALSREPGEGLAGRLHPDLPDQHKILIPPELFARLLGRSPMGRTWLGGVLLPEVMVDAPLRSRRLSRDAIQQVLAERSIFEWPHTFITSTWHGMPPSGAGLTHHLSPALVQALCELPWTRASGRAQRQPAAV